MNIVNNISNVVKSNYNVFPSAPLEKIRPYCDCEENSISPFNSGKIIEKLINKELNKNFRDRTMIMNFSDQCIDIIKKLGSEDFDPLA